MIALNPALDLFPMLAAMLAAVCCAVVGNFLVLRRLSLMGDAISHAVLPGLVIAFLLSASRNPLAMFLGAAAAGIATVVLVEVVKRLGRVEPGAAMGVVFSVLFALGVLLIEKAAARQTDLDADCVLYGQLETLTWHAGPMAWSGVWSWATLEAVPRQVWTLAAMTGLAFGFVALLFKELRLAAFDPALATALGFSAAGLHYALMVFVAGATVASFEAVGSILVIAMLVCPAATARLLTDRLGSQIAWSVGIAALSAALGYVAADAVPGAFGKDAVNAAGSMTLVSGALLVVAIVSAPRHGVAARALRRRRLARRVARDDLLGALYRAEETGEGGASLAELTRLLPGRDVRAAAERAAPRGQVRIEGGRVTLTDEGRRTAAGLIRRHRLWETYLVDEAGLAPDHVHDTAEALEHLDIGPASGPRVDPQGKRIP